MYLPRAHGLLPTPFEGFLGFRGFGVDKTVDTFVPLTMNQLAVTIDVTGLISTNGAAQWQ